MVRDTSNFAILNTDAESIAAHKRKMQQLQKEKAHEEEINRMKQDLAEIKDLLLKLHQQRQ